MTQEHAVDHYGHWLPLYIAQPYKQVWIMRKLRADKAALHAQAYTCNPRASLRIHRLKFQAPCCVFMLPACCFCFMESLTPAQLRALFPKVMSVIRNRKACLLAELESTGAQAPTTADSPEPSRYELECEASAAALQQLILRV